MSTFQMYFELGIEHIADFKGYDHILFLIALCAIYQIKHWKKILILITAFTIGHSVTLVLATYDIIRISTKWIEFLIPVTIFLTAAGNIFQQKTDFSKGHHVYKYLIALFFGLIHGLGFSNYLHSLLSQESNITMPLFSFNLGIEVGQLMVVGVFLLLGILVMNVFKAKPREWALVFSGAGLGVALVLMMERIPV